VNTARKGARVERRARRLLESLGFTVVRSSASKGVADLVAFDGVCIRLVQIKCNGYASAIERERLKAVALPSCGTKEIWRYVDRQRGGPLIERV
jgi:Holliday junction resolvase